MLEKKSRNKKANLSLALARLIEAGNHLRVSKSSSLSGGSKKKLWIMGYGFAKRDSL